MEKTPDTRGVLGLCISTLGLSLTKPNACLGIAQFLIFFYFLLQLPTANLLAETSGCEPNYYSPPGNTDKAFDAEYPFGFPLVNQPVTSPGIIVRFSNPQFNIPAEEYCVDVEFQSLTDDEELFGMNIRFFYEESILELIDFRDFQGGYNLLSVPTILTSPPTFGYNFFGLGDPGNSAVDFVNGAIQLTDESNPPIIISSTSWTKLFQVCFTVDAPDPDSLHFCPSIVWDLEQNPANGGYLSGDDGVVITLTTEVTGVTEPADEQVVQYNWEYMGSGSAPPFGQPIETDCNNISFLPPFVIVCPSDIAVECGDSSLPESTGEATATGGCTGPPLIIYTDSTSTGGCGIAPLIFRTWIASDTCDHADTCIQVLTISDAGAIYGSVYNDLDVPIPGVEIMLIADINANQFFDTGDTVFSITMTDSISGGYEFTQVPPCSYVIKEELPAYHSMMSDYDETPDPDGNDQADGPDLEIPVELTPCEMDSNNKIKNVLCPSVFPTTPDHTICENDFVALEIEELNIGTVTYEWNFGSGALPVTAVGSGPHLIQYTATPENQTLGASVTITLRKSGCPDTSSQISLVNINVFPDASINGSTTSGCYYTNRTFVPVQPEITGASYQWDFGYGAVPPNASGYGPHTVYYDTAGTKTVTLLVMPNEPGAQCPDSSSLSFHINSCPANIIGSVKTIDNLPIAGVNLHLYADVDTNGIADNATLIRSVFTSSTGSYSMASLIPGNYVIYEVQPIGWYSVDDGDSTIDNDIVDNQDTLDNYIPVTLHASELDGVNAFVEGPVPGAITGFVFYDFNHNEFPEPIEGIASVSLKLFADADEDGVADTNSPVDSALTLINGSFGFTNVPVGHYVLVEFQAAEYYSVKDFDSSNDGDAVENLNEVNDTIPLTIDNDETDQHNYFIDGLGCGQVVLNTADDGSGSFRDIIECVAENDTVFFHPSLAGATIVIHSARIAIDKNLVIFSNANPRIKLTSQITGFFDIATETEVKFKGLDIISGLAGNNGAAFNNVGKLMLEDINIRRNPLLPFDQYLIYNAPTSQLFLIGNCHLESE